MFEFDNNTTRFSLRNAFRLAEASESVYNPSWDEVEKKVTQEWGFANFTPFEKDDTEAFICGNDAMLILAFRGTQTLEDWQTDFKVQLVESSVGRVHKGFTESLDNIWEEIKQSISQFRDKNQKIWITGHSPGGALAALAVDRLTEDDEDISGLYTFGQPRVGDKDFAGNFNWKIKSRAFRFVNDEDIVTRVPPRLLGYEETGTVRFFDTHGVLYKDNIFWKKWLSLSESATVRSLDRFQELKSRYPNCTEDHSLARYPANIRKNYVKETGVKTFKDYLQAM